MNEVAVFVGDEQDDKQLDVAFWLALANKVLKAQGVSPNLEVNILFVDKPTIAALNERFMGKTGPTDVLSFPIDEAFPDTGRVPDNGGTGPTKNDDDDFESHEPSMLGDVIICPSVADERAPDHAGNFEDEIALLLVHGLLHLMGMDHEEEGEAEEMEARERELLTAHYREIRAEAWNVPRSESHSPIISLMDDDDYDDELDEEDFDDDDGDEDFDDEDFDDDEFDDDDEENDDIDEDEFARGIEQVLGDVGALDESTERSTRADVEVDNPNADPDAKPSEDGNGSGPGEQNR